MKKNKQLEAKINKYFNKWKKLLFLDGLFLTLSISYKENNLCGECSFSYPYVDNCITIYIKNIDDKNCEQVILHELLHVVTDKLYSVAYSRFTTKEEVEKERENLTDVLTSIILKTHERT